MKKLQLTVVAFLVMAFMQLHAQSEDFTFTLEEAKAYALKNGYQIKLAELDVDKSKSKVNETISIGLPQISAGGQYINNIEIPPTAVPAEFFGGEEGELATVRFGAEQTMSANITANQLIFDGSYLVGLQATKVYLELSKNELEKSKIDVLSLVTQAYGNVLVAEENLEILNNNRKNLEQLAYESEEVFKAGLGEEQDRDQAKLNLQSLTNQYENAGRQLEVAKNQLKFMIGVPVEANLTLTDNLDAIISTSKGSFAEKEFNLENHIDYRSVITQEKATQLVLKQNKSVYLPTLSGFYTYQTNSFSNEFNFFGDGDWLSGQFVGLNLNVPIFTSFANKNRVQQAKLDYQKIQVAKQQVEQNLKIQSENAKSIYLFSMNQFEIANENLDLANRIYDKEKAKYDEGVSSSLSLTIANNQLLQAQQTYIQASFQLIDSKIKLDQALNNF